MEYIPDDLLSSLLSKTELIAGVAAGLVVFIVILVIACKCNLFNKVRKSDFPSIFLRFIIHNLGENLQTGWGRGGRGWG